MNLLEVALGSNFASGVLLAAAALILYPVLYREVRVRPDAFWTREDVLGVLFAPLITMLLVLAIMFTGMGVSAWSVQPPTGQELTLAGAAAVVTALTWIGLLPAREGRAAKDEEGARQPQAAVATG